MTQSQAQIGWKVTRKNSIWPVVLFLWLLKSYIEFQTVLSEKQHKTRMREKQMEGERQKQEEATYCCLISKTTEIHHEKKLPYQFFATIEIVNPSWEKNSWTPHLNFQLDQVEQTDSGNTKTYWHKRLIQYLPTAKFVT